MTTGASATPPSVRGGERHGAGSSRVSADRARGARLGSISISSQGALGCIPEVLLWDNVSTVGGLVAAGLGVSALPGLVSNLIGVPGLARRPITDPVVDRELAVITAAGRAQSPSGRLLLDRLEQLEGGVVLPEGVMWHAAGRSR